MMASQLAIPATVRGRFGPYGGRYVPETLMVPLLELEHTYEQAKSDPVFQARFQDLLKNFAGRPTPLQFASRLTAYLGGPKIYLKREDLLHTGAHKINNAIGQGLLAVQMKKPRVVAETGAGPPRSRHRHCLRAPWAPVCRIHGDRRHGAPGAQCFAHAHARSRSSRRK